MNHQAALRTITGYKLIDCHSGRTVRTYPVGEASFRRATRAADGLDAQWGAVRYTVKPEYAA